MTLPGRVPGKLREAWAQLPEDAQSALYSHIRGGTSADYLSSWLTRYGTPVGATTIKTYRQQIAQGTGA